MTGSLLDAALAGDPSRPFVTYYGDGTGERVELSVTTLANWVAKTCGLLVDGLGLEAGDRVRLDLPRHWQTPVWALAAWQVGLVVDLDGDLASARLAVCGPDGLAAALAAEDVVALSLRPMGAPFPPGELPPHVLDYGREVGGYADYFAGPEIDEAAAAAEVAGRSYSLDDLRETAAGLAARWGLGARGRLHVSTPLEPLTELLAQTLTPLGVDGSVVLGGADRGESERTTAEAG
jgi:uncharacterized protein (TIGR03089 family)